MVICTYICTGLDGSGHQQKAVSQPQLTCLQLIAGLVIMALWLQGKIDEHFVEIG
jgi:hypothetical protein